MGRFISADTIVPNPANPQSFNRYSYCLNNPLKYIDPSGHQELGDIDAAANPSVYYFGGVEVNNSSGSSDGGAGGRGGSRDTGSNYAIAQGWDWISDYLEFRKEYPKPLYEWDVAKFETPGPSLDINTWHLALALKNPYFFLFGSNFTVEWGAWNTPIFIVPEASPIAWTMHKLGWGAVNLGITNWFREPWLLTKYRRHEGTHRLQFNREGLLFTWNYHTDSGKKEFYEKEARFWQDRHPNPLDWPNYVIANIMK